MILYLVLFFAVHAAGYVVPSLDPFYAPADGYEAKKLGEVLKTRQVTTPKYSNVQAAYQLQYRSSGTFGDAMAAITTVLVPKSAQSGKMLTYCAPEDSAYINCATSYTLLTGAAQPEIQQVLDAGLIVNVPDHEGPNSAYDASILQGHLTLDSIKAALNLPVDQLGNEVTNALWGYSGGSSGVGFASELQAEYAPDVKIGGSAMGGVISDLGGAFEPLDKTMYCGFIPAVIWGLSTEYKGFKNLVDNGLVELTKPVFSKPLSQCSTQNLVTFAYQSIFDTYIKNSLKALDDPDIVSALESLKMGSKKPSMPMYVYHGTADEIIPIAGVDSAVDEYCTKGATVSYNKYKGGTHLQTAADGNAAAFKFLQNALNSNVSFTGCSTEVHKL